MFAMFKTLSERNTVRLVWVPGHSNVTRNLKADSLAKAGGEIAPIGPESVCGIPYKAVKQEFGTSSTGGEFLDRRTLTDC